MEAEARQLVELPRRRSLPAAVIAALRPRQWSKNLLVLAGLVFAAKLGAQNLCSGRAAAGASRYVGAAAAFSGKLEDQRDAVGSRVRFALGHFLDCSDWIDSSRRRHQRASATTSASRAKSSRRFISVTAIVTAFSSSG